MQTVTKAIYLKGELKTQTAKKDKDYSGLIVAMIFLALGAVVTILSVLGQISN